MLNWIRVRPGLIESGCGRYSIKRTRRRLLPTTARVWGRKTITYWLLKVDGKERGREGGFPTQEDAKRVAEYIFREMQGRQKYKTNAPQGWGGDPKRGAALGRASIDLSVDEAQNFKGKLHLRQVKLDAGGYDSNGTYFGHGHQLYWCANEDGTVDFVLRAHSREDAKSKVHNTYPGARFYR